MDIFSTIDKVRINELRGNNTINIVGWAVAETEEIPVLKLKINGVYQKFDIQTKARPDVTSYIERILNDRKKKESVVKNKIDMPSMKCGFSISVRHFPYQLLSIELYAEAAGAIKRILYLDRKHINKISTKGDILYGVDEVSYNEKIQGYTINGYATSISGKKIDILVNNDHGEKIESYVEWSERHDLIREALAEEGNKCGFSLTFKGKPKTVYILHFITDTEDISYKCHKVKNTDKTRSVLQSQLSLIFTKQNFRSTWNYIRHKGIKETLERMRFFLKGDAYYDVWFKKHKVTDDQLNEQKNVRFDYEPKISLLVPMYNTPVQFLDQMIDTVRKQSYSNWELCIADGSLKEHPAHKAVGEYAAKDPRIKVTYLEKNYGISGNTNKALELATGDYIAMYDHDDFLELDALYEIVRAINEHHADIVYTDEDKFSMKTMRYEYPHFKTDFAIDLLRSHNYICHLFVVKADIMHEVGGFRSEYDGSQDYDMILRCCEKTDKIYHLPKVVYHWRMHANSTAADPESKMYCYIAGQKALEAHLKRQNIDGTVEMYKPYYGHYHIRYTLHDDPLVSIIIPNKDNTKVLKRCIDSLYKVSSYQNFEVIIVENNSTTDEIRQYYKQVQKEHNNIHVVTWSGRTFNYSAINNFGVTFAKGKYLLFLNNDTEMIAPDSIAEMAGMVQREEVGAVGAKLLYEDDTVQHAGIIVGLGGIANNAFQHIGRYQPGYMMRNLINTNYSAVTGACLMTRKNLFEQVGGFDEKLAVAYNDVDLCLKYRNLHKYNVFNVFSLWYHYESISRGYEDSAEKIERLNRESALMKEKWPEIFANGDPFYSPNFDLTHPFELKG